RIFGEGRRSRIAHLSRHVADQRLEQLLLRIEVGVESAESDAGALGDTNDRAVEETAFAEFLARSVEDFAQRALASRRPRRFAAWSARPRLLLHFHPHCGSLSSRTIFAS